MNKKERTIWAVTYIPDEQVYWAFTSEEKTNDAIQEIIKDLKEGDFDFEKEITLEDFKITKVTLDRISNG